MLTHAEATAIVHTDIRGQRVELSYEEFSKRAMGMGYYLRSRKLSRVGILAPNTPGFLTAIYGISGAGGVNAGQFLPHSSINLEFDLPNELLTVIPP